MEGKTCYSTNRRIDNNPGSVEFKCPNCLDATIVRTAEARKLSRKYTCPKCGFIGPN